MPPERGVGRLCRDLSFGWSGRRPESDRPFASSAEATPAANGAIQIRREFEFTAGIIWAGD
jgi:hypothetical protein